MPNDAAEIDLDNGASWDKFGPIYPMVRAPTSGSWSWVNQGTATATDSASGLYLADATSHAGNSLAIFKRAMPTNKIVIAHLSMVFAPAGSPTAGVIWRQSGGGTPGRIVAIGMYVTNTASLAVAQKLTSPTAWNSNYFQYGGFNSTNWWVKFVVNANNRETYFGPDGRNWVLVHSIGNTDFCTADEVGIYVDASGAAGGMLVDSWVES
jgi:hypothetical protein